MSGLKTLAAGHRPVFGTVGGLHFVHRQHSGVTGRVTVAAGDEVEVIIVQDNNAKNQSSDAFRAATMANMQQSNSGSNEANEENDSHQATCDALLRQLADLTMKIADRRAMLVENAHAPASDLEGFRKVVRYFLDPLLNQEAALRARLAEMSCTLGTPLDLDGIDFTNTDFG